MSDPQEIGVATPERQFANARLSPSQGKIAASSPDFRILELEIENVRLQRLIAELLLKNQQLRKAGE